MRIVSLVFGAVEAALILVLLWRAARGRFVSKFPLFYSYVVYWLCWSTPFFIASQISSSIHWTIFWRFFLLNMVAEFGVLVEISNQIFSPFPAVRKLGRVMTIGISIIFASFLLPSLFRSGSPTSALLSFGVMTSIAKAAIVCALLATVRLYQLPLGRNVSGMLLGFGVYVGVNVANFALAEGLGRAAYAATFGWVGGVSHALCLLIWAVTMWRYEPAVAIPPAGGGDGHSTLESLTYQLERFNTTLGSLLRK